MLKWAGPLTRLEAAVKERGAGAYVMTVSADGRPHVTYAPVRWQGDGLAAEVGAHGITVNAIAPGGIETDMSRDVMTDEYRARRLAELPLRRFGRVDDVAYCAVILASDDAGYLTGQILHPSGGWVTG